MSIRRWLLCAIVFVPAAPALGAMEGLPTREQMWEVIQQQQVRIEALERRLADTDTGLAATKGELQVTTARLEATADMLEGVEMSGGPAESRTHIGGYGELHYTNLDSNLDTTEEMDLHRFVLFTGYDFTDDLHFFAEFEIEHAIAGEGKAGEVEVEQAYVEWRFADAHHLDLGVFLLPVGILNETHEPSTFYGVERNAVEKNIIPATWWEGGAMLSGEFAPGWRYDLAVHSGLNLDTDNGSASKRASIRSARQKVGKARASDLAYTGRVRYSGLSGLQLGISLQYQEDLTQSDADHVGIDPIDGYLFALDLALDRGPFQLRALYARWDLDSDINLLNPGADEQFGWYLEPSFRLGDKLGLFARYSRFDLTAGNGISSEKSAIDVGINYWLHPGVVLKADIHREDNDTGADVDGFNLGVGYHF